ncbi:hypothetical protein AZO1586I_1066 [Bathymodiolus thermophilus thioautotrophic gill symbiont]|jgi:hypothetical protein|nr:hypothetical protein AZO1586I_1066 [Bathymodiolus thermophilus thioautotrophic gill symbiont]CAB5506828.1 hypothetical protein AZO1586R_2170 [Bathymodiolus azoricus thioautotrophic gill symbiont]CAC9515574.1 hypothetical protein [uncultured Gammaproteobacteria bacterium]SSC09686.1 hypothetical protein BPUTEOSOX_1145 [thiotrophic endosymbiont of Bathymodiolus puteoserpentis (Logatchev)]CAC9518800.1 hypothetical protein [uncultured Gammaproteobacteria bacterium]
MGVFMTEVLVVLVILAIMVALGFGLLGLLKGGKAGSDRMFKSLVIRVSLSIALFLFVMFSGYMGWIQSNIVMLDAPTKQTPVQK